VNGSEADTIGAIMMVAVIGSTTSASTGAPRIAKPPPNAPRASDIRNTALRPTM